MAATAEATRLTEAHRLAQARLGARAVADMVTVWALLDAKNLDGSVSRWLQAVVPLVQARRSTSARLAANYLSTFRALELGVDSGGIIPQLAETADVKALTTSLLVTGLVSIKAAMVRGVGLDIADETAMARAGGAGMRFVLDGGRETITETVRADQRAVGWTRVTSGSPCEFCSMLAGRGAVYKEDTVDFPAHDHCSCAAEPLYD